MIRVKNGKGFLSRLLNRRLIALMQLLVMVMLAVPAFCADEAPLDGVSVVASALDFGDTDHDSCPCCPEDEDGSDDCSACNYCSHYAPLSSVPSFRYVPSVADLSFPEPFSKPMDVQIPIFVPPQNLA